MDVLEQSCTPSATVEHRSDTIDHVKATVEHGGDTIDNVRAIELEVDSTGATEATWSAGAAGGARAASAAAVLVEGGAAANGRSQASARTRACEGPGACGVAAPHRSSAHPVGQPVVATSRGGPREVRPPEAPDSARAAAEATAAAEGDESGSEEDVAELALPPYLPGVAAAASSRHDEPLGELDDILSSAVLPCTHADQRVTASLAEAKMNPKLVLRRALRHWGPEVPEYESWQDYRGGWKSLQLLPEFGIRGFGGPRRTKADAQREASWTIIQQLQDWVLWQ